MRTGLVAKKLGMTRIMDENGTSVAVTLLQADCEVVGQKTKEKDGYTALQIGFGSRKAKNVNKPQRVELAKREIDPKAKIVEFRVADDALVEVGSKISPTHFIEGQFVDISGVTIGKGFQGGMKRHNFGGLEATHGISISHRSHGSTGQCQDPGRVFKGKKMAGHMGNVKTTIQNLTIVKTDEEDSIIAVKGSVPGSKGQYVLIKDSVKKAKNENAPYPAAIAEKKTEAKTEEKAENADSAPEAETKNQGDE